jgi:hypothetical protein
MKRDKIAKTSRDRYFPLTPSEVVSAVSEGNFNVNSYHERLPVRLENSAHVCALGHQLASFHRMGYLAVFSLPLDMVSTLGSSAAKKSIDEFSKIDKEPHLKVREQQFVLYRAFLGALGHLSIVYDIVSGGSRSYLAYDRATQLSKSTESKSKFVSIREIGLTS